MSEKPIIFSAPMVRALIDGKKTQTRRVLKDQPGSNEPIAGASPYDDDWVWRNGWDGSIHRLMWPGVPFTIGDRLWVREAWRYWGWTEDGEPWLEYRADQKRRYIRDGDIPEEWFDRLQDIWADLSSGPRTPDGRHADVRWRSPIHMPRWASRITLTVTDVRVQRLQEISEEDAVAEGCNDKRSPHYPQEQFANLWNSIHGDGAWDKNPWVCALTFTVDHQGDVR